MEKSACFIGDKLYNDKDEIELHLYYTIYGLIKKHITNFLFGDNTEFVESCYNAVTKLIENKNSVKRINFLSNDNLNFYFEENYYPEDFVKSNEIDTLQKNCLMIDESVVCVFYYDFTFGESEKIIRSSLKYANKKQKPIINVFENYNIPFI